MYNTNTALGEGVYYRDAANKWVNVSNGTFTEADGVIGNEITDVIPGGGLTRSGSGTAKDPYMVGLDSNGAVDGSVMTWQNNKWAASTPPASSSKAPFIWAGEVKSDIMDIPANFNASNCKCKGLFGFRN